MTFQERVVARELAKAIRLVEDFPNNPYAAMNLARATDSAKAFRPSRPPNLVLGPSRLRDEDFTREEESWIDSWLAHGRRRQDVVDRIVGRLNAFVGSHLTKSGYDAFSRMPVSQLKEIARGLAR